jgi:quinoprotein glucose dehydrogenase
MVIRRYLVRAARITVLPAALLIGATVISAQQGAKNGQWHSYGGDLGMTHYSPLDQINKDNFSKLEVMWRFKPTNLGDRPDFNMQATPLMINGTLYLTAGSHRNVVALDAKSGELKWMYRLEEGKRAEASVRKLSGRGVGYWTDGRNDERIYFVSIGYQLVCLDAKTGLPIRSFGKDGIIDLKAGGDQIIDPILGEIGWNGSPVVAKDVVIIGASHRGGSNPRTKENAKGYIRAFDTRSGKQLWIFHTIPQPGEFGNDTWEKDSWSYTGHTGVWAQFTVDEELGIVYLPVEDPTGDYMGMHRPGNNLFADSLVALNLQTGKRLWHFQFVHHPMWDYDIPCSPMLVDLAIDGRMRKIVVQPSKEGWLYVFDRQTGQPIWPIEERPVEKGTVPGEWYSPTQPHPTKPPSYELQGINEKDLIDFTPEIKAEAVKIWSQYKTGPIFTPPIVIGEGGKQGLLYVANGANWPGGSYDPETGMLYVYSHTLTRVVGLVKGAPRSNMDFVSGGGGEDRVLSVQGMPLVKPPWGRITAFNMSKGDLVWQIAHGETPDYVKNNPSLKGVNIPRTGRLGGAGGSSGGIGILLTKTLLISGEGGVFTTPNGQRGAMLRAYDKATGKEFGAVYMPGSQTGTPMTYMLGGKQYIVVSTGGGNIQSEMLAYALP